MLKPNSTPVLSELGTDVTIPSTIIWLMVVLMLGEMSGGVNSGSKKISQEGVVWSPEPPLMSLLFSLDFHIYVQIQTGDEDSTTEYNENYDGLDSFEDGSVFNVNTVLVRSSISVLLKLLYPKTPGVINNLPYLQDSHSGTNNDISDDNDVFVLNYLFLRQKKCVYFVSGVLGFFRITCCQWWSKYPCCWKYQYLIRQLQLPS